MMKLNEVIEIFSDKKLFSRKTRENKKRFSQTIEMRTLSKDGKWHYTFDIKETEFNQGATVDFGKWHPLDARMLCFNICDKDFLLSIVDSCKKGNL